MLQERAWDSFLFIPRSPGIMRSVQMPQALPFPARPRASLELIAPEDLHAIWHVIRPGLLKVQNRSNQSHWLPEDVYFACRSGASKLHVSYVDGEYSGFCVLTPVQHYDGTVLHIWCAYNASNHDVLTLYEEDIEQIARAIKARRITFWSSRKFERRVAKYGYHPTQTEYVKEL